MLDQIRSGELEALMILCIKDDEERVYLHRFSDEVSALEFLELMASGLRADFFEKLLMRTMN